MYTKEQFDELILELREATRELQESNDEAEQKEMARLQQMGEGRSL
jgi:hypothetical protein